MLKAKLCRCMRRPLSPLQHTIQRRAPVSHTLVCAREPSLPFNEDSPHRSTMTPIKRPPVGTGLKCRHALWPAREPHVPSPDTQNRNRSVRHPVRRGHTIIAQQKTHRASAALPKQPKLYTLTAWVFMVSSSAFVMSRRQAAETMVWSITPTARLFSSTTCTPTARTSATTQLAGSGGSQLRRRTTRIPAAPSSPSAPASQSQ